MSQLKFWHRLCGSLTAVMLVAGVAACDRGGEVVVEAPPTPTYEAPAPPADTAEVVYTPGDGFDDLHDLLQRQVGTLPEGGIDGLDGGQSGVAALVRHNGEVVYNEAFGYERKWDAGPDQKPVLRPES